jgi:pilus assembly protein CpaF
VFERTGVDENGKVRGAFRATGVRPQFAERLASAGGARLRPALFESKVRSESGENLKSRFGRASV